MVDAATTELLAANEAFYDAFERNDLAAMIDLWSHTDDVVCVHPGWRPLRGWPSVEASWAALFGNGQPLQFILTAVSSRVVGEAGWVHLEENLLNGPQTSTVAALNVFERVEGRWQVVAHHGSGVASR